MYIMCTLAVHACTEYIGCVIGDIHLGKGLSDELVNL